MWDNTKWAKTCVIRVPEREWGIKTFKEMTKNFPNLMGNTESILYCLYTESEFIGRAYVSD